MIKYYRINHEGFHRIGIVLGVISLIISPWILLYSLGFYYSFSFADIITEFYEKTGNVVDVLGVIELTGYNVSEVEFNFHQLMEIYYVSTKKIESYELISITH